jgi:serine/threonine-protein kinase
MSEPPPSAPKGASSEATHSLLSEQLSVALPPPEPEALHNEERAKLAAAKVGLTLKGWRLTRLLGLGPVSAAFEATRGTQDGASRGVLRLVIGSIASNERARGQFVRAAYAASRFQHPRVVSVVADGADEAGAPFVVRTWADAEPLAALVERDGPMVEGKLLRLAEQVLDALEIAHAHGVVHSALSPTNVLVTPRGSIRICDFASPPGGYARSEADVLAARRVGPWTPPERCSLSPDAPTEAGDVWSLGALLYFAASKAAPRGDATSVDALARTNPRPLRDLVPGVSEPFAHMIEHALASDPTLRYESAYAMLGDVRRVMAGRKPKLVDAQRPNPSGSYSGPPPSRSARQLPTSSSRIDIGRAGLTTTRSEHPRRSEWRGNLALILAIATLVGVATFVMVRERVEDARQHPGGTPPDTGEPQ